MTYIIAILLFLIAAYLFRKVIVVIAAIGLIYYVYATANSKTQAEAQAKASVDIVYNTDRRRDRHFPLLVAVKNNAEVELKGMRLNIISYISKPVPDQALGWYKRDRRVTIDAVAPTRTLYLCAAVPRLRKESAIKAYSSTTDPAPELRTYRASLGV